VLEFDRLTMASFTLAQCGECDDGCESCDAGWMLLPVCSFEEFVQLLSSDPEVVS
jgi:hypothetical protein